MVQGKLHTQKKPGLVKRRPNIDYSLLAITLVLVVLGLIMVYSASYYSTQVKNRPASEVFIKQCISALIGFVLMAVLAHVDYHVLQDNRIVVGMLGASILLLLLVLVPGVGVFANGSRRWILVPIIKLSFQPSELAKFALVLYMAKGMTVNQDQMGSFKRGMLPYILAAGIVFGLIMMQPNLSTGGSILILTLIMLILGGAKARYFITFGAAGLAAAVPLVIFENYRLQRYLSFSNPWKTAASTGYQLVQSLLAFGSGGLFGVGLGNSRQKYNFLPYADSDFIFAIVGEEFGFVGAMVVLLLFTTLIFFGYRVAVNCRDRFGTLLAAGITSVIAIQVVINVAVATGSMPTTGVPLPFFSSGGTSMYIFLGAIGVLLSISRNTRRLTQ